MAEIVRLSIKKLLPNSGQIDGLPSNPRTWTKEDVERIAKSLKETPELFEMRPCIVFPLEGKYIILGGNLRFQGALKNKDKDCPCIVLPENTSVDKMKEIVIKDNGSFGSWDYDLLANEWPDEPLSDWGVVGIPSADDIEGKGTAAKEFGAEDFEENMTMHFKFNDDDIAYVREELGRIDPDYSKAILKLLKYGK